MSPTGVVQRALLRNQVDGTLIVLGSQRFDFIRLSPKPSPQELSRFSAEAGEALSNLTDALSINGHRLALIQEGLLEEMPEQEMNGIALRLGAQPALYEGQSPFEWDWRQAYHVDRDINGQSEMSNTIATIKRCSGTIRSSNLVSSDERPFDCIRVDFDINTLPTNDEQRFVSKQVRRFFEEAPGWHEELAAAIQALLARK